MFRFVTLVLLLLAWNSLQAVSAHVTFVGSSTAPQNDGTMRNKIILYSLLTIHCFAI